MHGRRRKRVNLINCTVKLPDVKVYDARAGAGVMITKHEPCHADPTVLFGQLYLGGNCANEMADAGVDIMVPLKGWLDSSVWKSWNGIIYAVPIPDYGVLPDSVLASKVATVIDWLVRGRSVGLYCMGGHGRTGYFASCVLGQWKPEVGDPIKYLRENYCKKVVESQKQIDSIADFLNLPALKENAPVKTFDAWWLPYDGYLGYNYVFPSRTGDLKYCIGCGAVLSQYSTSTKNKDCCRWCIP